MADAGLLSGLSNCGYTPQDAASLQKIWVPLLNRWHLFDDRHHASAFVAVTADRVPEHAPFLVYGIAAPSNPDPQDS
ncbi:MAG: hypothetical protein ACRDSR_11065 [Pseudonocardiaceae bacterium]